MMTRPWQFDDPDDPLLPDHGGTVRMLIWFEWFDAKDYEIVPLVRPEWASMFEDLIAWDGAVPFDGVYLAEFQIRMEMDEEGDPYSILLTMTDQVHFPTPTAEQIADRPLDDFRGGSNA